MKNRNDQQLTQYEIPGGEGFNALPIAFISSPPPLSHRERGKGLE